MNKTTKLAPHGEADSEIIATVVRALGAHIHAEWDQRAEEVRADRDGPVADFAVDLTLNGKKYPYLVETKRSVERSIDIASIAHRPSQGLPLLLVTTFVRPALAEACRALDLQFIDASGNAYLHSGDLYVFVTGRPRSAEFPQQTSAAGTTAAVKLTFALLCQPKLLNASYRDIAAAADVSLGAVGGILESLRERNFIVGSDTRGKRQLNEPKRLAQEWVAHYTARLRPKLHSRFYEATLPAWWQSVPLPADVALWGGEVAAQRMTRMNRPETQTLYVVPGLRNPLLAELAPKIQLRASSQGSLEIVDAFWRFDIEGPNPDCVPPLLVYADLLRGHDPRNIESAQRVLELM